MNQSQKSAKPITLPLLISIIFISFSSIFVKWSDAPATILSMYRMALASALILPFVWGRRSELKTISFHKGLFLLLSGLFLALHFALWFGSLKLTTVASSTIILTLQPVIALIGGFILYKQKTNKFALISMLTAMIGSVIIGWGDFGLSTSAIIGDFLSFLSVVAVVSYLLIGQKIVKELSHWIYTFFVFLFAALLLCIYNIAAGIPILGYSKYEWGIFLLLAIFPSVSHMIYNWLLSYIDSTTISMSILGEPVGATILAVILLGERLTAWQIFGGLLVLIGVTIFLIQQQNNMKKVE